MTDELQRSDRTVLRRKRERGSYDRGLVRAILDEALICHVGVNDGTTTFVTPMTFARIDDLLYLHGAPANRTLQLIAGGSEACVEATILDGLVLARSAYHHSMNFRSVMLLGHGERVRDPAEAMAASVALLEHVAPGRSADARLPSDSELRSTLIVRIPIEEASAKVRSGPPIDDAEDLGLPIWAGHLHVATVIGPAVADPGLDPSIDAPAYVADYPPRSALA